ncbi:MAG: hypothetical protein C4291_11085 [Candidatus Dadabacteria bacterium]
MKRKAFNLFLPLFLLIFISSEGVVNPKEKSKSSTQTKNSSAVEYYQKGRKSYLLFTPKGFLDAINYYNKAIEADPNFAPAYSGLGEIYSFIGYYKMEVKEDYEDSYNRSYENMLKALKLDPKSIDTQRALALSYLHLRRIDEAEAAARRALELDPNDAESYYVLWATSGRDPESPYIKKALELDPKLVVAYIGLGNAYLFNKGNYAKATEYYRKAVEITNSPQLHNYLGTSLRTQGYFDEAVSEYLKAIELDPNYAPAYMNLGATFLYMSKFGDSINEEQKAISLNSNDPEAYYHLARALELSGKPKEAIENYRIFINLASDQEKYADYVENARRSIEKMSRK